MMSGMEIFLRSASGFVLFAPFFIKYLRNNGAKPLHNLGRAVLCYYLFGLWTVTGMRLPKGLYPRLCHAGFGGHFLDELVLNIILFVPLGVLLPLLYKKFKNPLKTLLAGLALSLTVEAVQLFGLGATDIHDVAMNSAGAAVGYLIFRVLSLPAGKLMEKFARGAGEKSGGELFYLSTRSLLIMMTIQPIFIRIFFHMR